MFYKTMKELIEKESENKYKLNDNYTLTPVQVEGVTYLLSRTKGVLGFSTGTGKTLVTLTAAEVMRRYLESKGKTVHINIFVPNSALSAFRRHMSKEFLGVGYNEFTSSKDEYNSNNNYSLYSMSTLKSRKEYQKQLMTNLTVPDYNINIIDEIHTLQNFDSQLYKTMFFFRNKMKIVFGSTATPLQNNIKGLYSVLTFISPGILSTYKDFRANYVVLKRRRRKGGGFFFEEKGYKNLPALKRIIDPLVFVRKVEYKLKFHYITSVLDEMISYKYYLAAQGFMQAPDEDGDVAWAPRLHYLQRIVDNALDYQEEQKALVRVSDKEKELLKLLKEKTKEQAVIVYVEYYDTLERLQYVFSKVLKDTKVHIISGKVDKGQRDYIESNLKEKEIVLMTKAGGQSISLQQSNNVVFYDIPFSLGAYIQIVGRITRLDTEHKYLNVYHIATKDTIDEYKLLLMKKNQKIIKYLFGDSAQLDNIKEDVSNLHKIMHMNNISYLRKKLLWKMKSKS